MGYRNEQSNSLCRKHYEAITTFHPPLKREFANNITDVEARVSTVDHFCIYAVDPLIQLKLGMRNGRASDANKIKVLTGALLSTSELVVVLGHTSKADRGFNSNNTGWLLIPAEYIEDYNDDPVRWVIKAVVLRLLIAMHSVRRWWTPEVMCMLWQQIASWHSCTRIIQGTIWTTYSEPDARILPPSCK